MLFEKVFSLKTPMSKYNYTNTLNIYKEEYGEYPEFLYMNFSKKQIGIMGVIAVCVAILGMAIASMFIKETDDFKPPNNNTEQNTQHEIKVNRTDEEEANAVKDIIGNAVKGDMSGYRPVATQDSERPVLDETSYNTFKDEILSFLGGNNYQDAQNLANLILSEYKVENLNWHNDLYMLGSIAGMWEDSTEARMDAITSITDANIYVVLFASLTPEEQGALIPRMNMVMLPDGTSQTHFVSSADASDSTYYSEAYRYFTAFDALEISKVHIVYGDNSEYDVYYGYDTETGKALITNIIETGKTIDECTTYEAYYEFNGTSAYEIEYD